MTAQDLSAFKNTKAIWEAMQEEILLASSVRLLRNLSKFKFVSKLDDQAKGQVLKFISNALANHPKLIKPTIIRADQIKGEDKELLFERFLFLEGLNQASSQEAFAFDETGTFLAIINLCEHLQLIKISSGERIDKLLSELIAIETQLSQLLDFAYSHRFGFLSAQPTRCGTALSALMLLHLPALIQSGRYTQTFADLQEDDIHLHGLTAEGFMADIVVLENKHTIGISEEKIIASLQSLASRLSIAEMSERKAIQQNSNQELMDRVARAYGLVKHSYMLDTKEAMQAISLLKLGSLMGWLKGLQTPKLNAWLFNVQRSHIKQLRSITDQDAIAVSHQRALALHEMLGACELLI